MNGSLYTLPIELRLDVAVMFALGMLAYLWRATMPLSRGIALAMLVLLAIDSGGMVGAALFAPMLAYLVLTFAYHPRSQSCRGMRSRIGCSA